MEEAAAVAQETPYSGDGQAGALPELRRDQAVRRLVTFIVETYIDDTDEAGDPFV